MWKDHPVADVCMQGSPPSDTSTIETNAGTINTTLGSLPDLQVLVLGA